MMKMDAEHDDWKTVGTTYKKGDRVVWDGVELECLGSYSIPEEKKKGFVMTLNTARKIEIAFAWVLYILLLPFGILYALLALIRKVLERILDGRNWLAYKVGHKLMHMSDAVKDGTIKNPDCLKHYTAWMAWKGLKEEEKLKKENDV